MNLWRAAALLAACTALAPAARAQAPADPGADWAVAGRVVFRIRAAYKEMSPERRVEELDYRLNEILSKQDRAIGAADITLTQSKGSAGILVLGDLLVTVTAADAAANKTTVAKLGQVWLANIRKTVPLVTPRLNRGGA